MDLIDRCCEARARLLAHAAYHERLAKETKLHDRRISRQARAEAYRVAVRILDKAMATNRG